VKVQSAKRKAQNVGRVSPAPNIIGVGEAHPQHLRSKYITLPSGKISLAARRISPDRKVRFQGTSKEHYFILLKKADV